ncbi:MAG TPA: caspase family protein [Bryobacteraceae bacterium]|nr:caspase family protein [Bryobacteraceae bacterium]
MAVRGCLFFWCLLLSGQQPRDLRLELAPPQNPLRDRGGRWALVVGVSNYQHLPPAAQLRFAHRDAEEFSTFLRSTAGGALPASRIRTLTNEKATLAAIRAALHAWLVDSTGPEDIVYVFFAGHGVVAEGEEPYFVAHDSDPQNLHATALPFSEMDRALSERLRANLVVLTADACHSGSLGWASYRADDRSKASEPLAHIGKGDRSFLKLLASRPSERSFEDERWNGGQGVFTHIMLEGLRGPADRDSDGFVRAAELIDYVSRYVPEQTQARQHPRVAGTFDARLALAAATVAPAAALQSGVLDIAGPPGAGIYIDNVFRGNVRRNGTLRVEALTTGTHRLSADLDEGTALEGSFSLTAPFSRMELARPQPSQLAQLRARIAAGRILETGGAFDFYRGLALTGAQRAPLTAALSAALEEMGQACVGDYVQSTQVGPKKVMLQRAVDAYETLQVLRPYDQSIESKKLFCRGRLQIAEGKFVEAVSTLQQSLQRDSQFACAYNALGVALDRLGQAQQSRRAFEMAARLTPEWGLPPFQIASQHIARGELKQALPYLEKAVQYNPRSVPNRWNLMKLHRLMGRLPEVERDAAELARLNPGYAPTQLELGRAYEAAGNSAKAADAYEAYLLMAPNFADSDEIRARAQRYRGIASRPPPTLRRKQ